MAATGVSQPRKTKLSGPWRSCRTTKSSQWAEKCLTWRSDRPPSPIDPSMAKSHTSTPAAIASPTPTAAPAIGHRARVRTSEYAR